ncbi:MAG: enoyl-CoA hydratase-related protein, partial [Myxococcota bacterium]|nr:enoyl-CoA hydratase-related protein [Myxococcota bacterium]
DDPQVRAVVVTGAGRSFCAGADFHTLLGLSEQTGLDGVLARRGAVEALYEGFLGLGRLEVPTIAAIQGAAVGGGLGIALQCDIRLVGEEAKIGANFVRLGIHSGLGISKLLPRAVGAQAAAEMLYTGRLIRGTEAAAMGLALRALPREDVLSAAMDLATEIAGSAPMAVRATKRSLRQTTDWDLEPTLRVEAMAQAMLMQSADAAEGVQAMMARRTPRFEGK